MAGAILGHSETMAVSPRLVGILPRLGYILPRLLVMVALGGLPVGCANTAISVSRDERGPAPGRAIVVGQFGTPPADDRGANTRKMKIVNLATREELAVPFREGSSRDGGRTAPFMIDLVPGRYQMTAWEISYMDGDLFQDDAFVTFNAYAGKVTCIGGVYPVRGRGRWTDIAPQFTLMKVHLLPRDECAELTAFVQSEAPHLRVPVDTQLAVNLHCRRCRAEPLTPADRAALAEEAVVLRTAEAESLRIGKDAPLEIALPESAEAGAYAHLRICVSAKGVPRSVELLSEVPPALAQQVLKAARGWRYQPYMTAAGAAPFCYEIGFGIVRSKPRVDD